MRVKLLQGDCLEKLKLYKENSFHSLVTDPPAGISFMGKEWDSGDKFIEGLSEIFKECFRILKPGGHGLIWALPRTSHRIGTALELSGFEIRDVITHLFGSGFPKSHNISKAIDKMYGAERKIVSTRLEHNICRPEGGGTPRLMTSSGNRETKEVHETEPATEEAKQWDGWGSALKPAAEFWFLVRKPLDEKTLAKNVVKWGTGGINIDECRIGRPDGNRNEPVSSTQGRFPSNLVLSHHPECELLGTKKVQSAWSNKGKASVNGYESTSYDMGKMQDRLKSRKQTLFDEEGKEVVEDWDCHPECAVRMLDVQSGVLKSGSGQKSKNRNTPCHQGGFKPDDKYFNSSEGGASRFFYCSKASKKDRGDNNKHPTVKNTKLMEYLITLITPPNGIVFDPFMGSGSTGVAALRKGFRFVGFEKDCQYFEIAKSRIEKEV